MPDAALPSAKTDRILHTGTDRCVKCGLCLPHCPTWNVHREEGDSPRGRISLIAAAAQSQLEISPTLQFHLDGCLTCRACEAACPAKVPFGRIMDRARRYWPSRPVRWAVLFRYRLARAGLRLALWMFAKSTLARIFRQWGRVGLLPQRVDLRRRLHATPGPQVGVFTGCVSDTVDRQTLNDAAVVLEQGGRDVRWVEAAGCCGALDRHQGNGRLADRQVQRNLAATAEIQELETLVSVATGCGAELADYASLSEDPQAQRWVSCHQDVLTYLQAVDLPQPKPLSGTVLLHHPCSARNVLKNTAAASAALGRIPKLTVVESSGCGCCGAAGVAMFRTPLMAETLGAGIVQELADSKAGWLATSNIGCALHLRQQIRSAGLKVRVCHPINLLREQLPS